MNYVEWYQNWKNNRKTERLGQAFCNDFIRESWPALYYCEDSEKSAQMICQWLIQYQYWPNMPTVAPVK